jgi:hypothetical protein
LKIIRRFKEEFPLLHGGFVFMLGLRTIILLLFLSVIAAASQNTAPTPLITSSVKLRVDAQNSHEWGTGTIIDARQGEALVLTCGHIFEKSQGQGNIEVHLFGDNSTVRVLGKCLFYDLEIDLALVAIKAPPFPVRVAPIAPVSYQIQQSQQAVSVGCDHGGNPTVRTHQILSINMARTPGTHRVPFNYVHVSGAPVSGRSGGGLFSSEGYLIGVCNTGDPQRNDGHFVPPHIVRHVLDTMGLADVYKKPSLGTPQMPPQALAALTPLPPLDSPPPMTAAVPAPMYSENKGVMSREDQATLEEIIRRMQDGDEVIVISRSRRNPEIRSDVVFLNGASDALVDALVKTPPANPTYNSVILSSNPMEQPARQPVSFPVNH